MTIQEYFVTGKQIPGFLLKYHNRHVLGTFAEETGSGKLFSGKKDGAK